ncbi:hypothetical protein [Martelella radicis]|uniref:Uncharacterized protein n=1 Tax=Martelella radicis TaxID=1397476 RepID=A0A7W6KQ84_9HYPH|nr:hypothetical protein [Martelella radicis]MBB4123968.1 hypothetical protein [Martelella radicis]
MDEADSGFREIEDAAAEKRRLADLNDLNNERNGDDVGRIARFLSPKARALARGEASDGKNGKRLSALELALLDPAYAFVYNAAVKENREAQNRAQAFQARIDDAIIHMQREIDGTLDKAITLPNGEKAFMNRHGEAWSADGDRVDDAIAEGFDWTGRPSLETYQDQKQRLERLEALSHEGRAMSLRLGEIGNDLDDRDHPLKKDEIDNLRAEMKSITDDIETMDRRLDSLVSDNSPGIQADHELAVVKTANLVPSL